MSERERELMQNNRTGELGYIHRGRVEVIAWPTRAPQDRARWVLALASGAPATVCPVHHARTDAKGVCNECTLDLIAEQETGDGVHDGTQRAVEVSTTKTERTDHHE